ncbi:MAG: hypothetical protein H7838_01865 [Magnetococcus sp. DMHC-8]
MKRFPLWTGMLMLLLLLAAWPGHPQDNDQGAAMRQTSEQQETTAGQEQPADSSRTTANSNQENALKWYRFAKEITISDYEYKFSSAFVFPLKIVFIITGLSYYRIQRNLKTTAIKYAIAIGLTYLVFLGFWKSALLSAMEGALFCIAVPLVVDLLKIRKEWLQILLVAPIMIVGTKMGLVLLAQFPKWLFWSLRT